MPAMRSGSDVTGGKEEAPATLARDTSNGGPT